MQRHAPQPLTYGDSVTNRGSQGPQSHGSDLQNSKSHPTDNRSFRDPQNSNCEKLEEPKHSQYRGSENIKEPQQMQFSDSGTFRQSQQTDHRGSEAFRESQQTQYRASGTTRGPQNAHSWGSNTKTEPPFAHSTQKCATNPSFVLSGDFLPNSFRVQSTQIAKDVIGYVCRHEDAVTPPSKQATIMRNLIDDALKNRLDMMCHLVLKLDVKSRDDLYLVDNIATSMFDDEKVNWGRIVTLCAFCGYLARYCEERYIPDCTEEVAKLLGNILVNRLGLWIVANGGWNAFEQQFPAVCIWDNSGLWKGVAVIALLIGAVIAFGSSVKFMNSS